MIRLLSAQVMGANRWTLTLGAAVIALLVVYLVVSFVSPCHSESTSRTTGGDSSSEKLEISKVSESK